eukprot:NODE_260_length_12610_cov_0.413076.p11 type:complete len:102 gc:universal NODE_260_length_12610_cov_0.413076:9130-9435(+)
MKVNLNIYTTFRSNFTMGRFNSIGFRSSSSYLEQNYGIMRICKCYVSCTFYCRTAKFKIMFLRNTQGHIFVFKGSNYRDYIYDTSELRFLNQIIDVLRAIC